MENRQLLKDEDERSRHQMGVPGVLRRFLATEDHVGWVKYRLLKKFAERLYAPIESNDGIHIVDQEWDNLIILDACRYDTFEQLEPELNLDGTLRKVESRGTRTVEFLRQNFPGTYDDIVYVSVNPFVITALNDPFYETVYVEATEKDQRDGALLPETVLDAALAANDRHPDKRLVVHFLQPHHPFVGDTEIEREFRELPDGTREKAENPWRLLGAGEISEARLREAYQDNLRRVFPAVEELAQELVGKTVVTSDHGEAFGASARTLPWQLYGHGGPRVSALIEVPWYELEYEERKTIVSGGEEKPSEKPDTEDIEGRLKALGYRE